MAMAGEKQESSGRVVVSDPNAGWTDGGDCGATALGQQASYALEGLRSVIEQASQVLRDLAQAGSQWVQNTDRAREMAQGLRARRAGCRNRLPTGRAEPDGEHRRGFCDGISAGDFDAPLSLLMRAI
jgi:hypothetical protein